MNFKKKLARMKPHLQTEAAQPEPPTNHQPLETKQWLDLQCSVIETDQGTVIHRQNTYPLGVAERDTLSFSHVFSEWSNLSVQQHPLKPKDHTQPSDLLFLDTETTGLSHGAGNMIFMIGTGRIVGNQMVIDQYLLPGPENEVAFYDYFLKQVHHLDALVTYNGKAFDWPQVRMRHTMLRHELPRLPEFGHFDLLHAARRLFKHQLPSCQLSVVEEEILQMGREEDTPGYLAPMYYQDYLQTADPTHLIGVFEHNEQDIKSLFTLYLELSDRVLGGGKTFDEAFEIARWWKQQGEWRLALHQFTSLVDKGYGNEAVVERARLLRKHVNEEESVKLYEQLYTAASIHKIEAARVLSMWYEHKKKQYDDALSVAYQGRLWCEHEPAKEKAAWEHRIHRLKGKCAHR
ncbi:ribonuclease H-like domain-containing protein [Geomicrobium sp. JSM 1781026]|uniref:ribonuclease H-like domain-containing protein n=1 Tax=Geomicrobium sp. JSM 1781026 TaxID=3344580 RepID=UPI0035BF0222